MSNVTNIQAATPTTNALASSSVMVFFSCGVWTARKLDKKVTAETNSRKRASAKASRTHKSLLPDADKLDRIVKYGAMVRNWYYTKTMPWDNSGNRILPAIVYFNPAQPTDFKREMDAHEAEFWRLVDDFVLHYDTLISKQAFELGDMFDRDEYPTADQIRKKFSFIVDYTPLATVNDWRLTIADEQLEDLKSDYEARYQAQYGKALADIRERMVKGLERISERFANDASGKRQRFNGDIIERFVEVMDDVRDLNIMQDPTIQQMLREAEQAVRHVDVQDVKENDTYRESVKSKVDDILDKFNF